MDVRGDAAEWALAWNLLYYTVPTSLTPPRLASRAIIYFQPQPQHGIAYLFRMHGAKFVSLILIFLFPRLSQRCCGYLLYWGY